MDNELRALERKARRTGDVEDVQRYSEELMRLGAAGLQPMLGTGRDVWQELMYRHALKNVGGGNAGLNLSLPHQWSFIGYDSGSGPLNFGEACIVLRQNCRVDPQTRQDDSGLHPFFDKEARPLTFKEIVEARIELWTLSNGRQWSFGPAHLDSCTGIVHEAGGRRIKIVPMDPRLLRADPSDDMFLMANFATTEGAPLVVDLTYNRPLRYEEVISHKGWLAALEGDADLLVRYANILFRERTTAMAFYTWPVREPPPRMDQLRPLAIDGLENNSDCDGNGYMGGDTRFIRMSPL